MNRLKKQEINLGQIRCTKNMNRLKKQENNLDQIRCTKNIRYKKDLNFQKSVRNLYFGFRCKLQKTNKHSKLLEYGSNKSKYMKKIYHCNVDFACHPNHKHSCGQKSCKCDHKQIASSQYFYDYKKAWNSCNSRFSYMKSSPHIACDYCIKYLNGGLFPDEIEDCPCLGQKQRRELGYKLVNKSIERNKRFDARYYSKNYTDYILFYNDLTKKFIFKPLLKITRS